MAAAAAAAAAGGDDALWERAIAQVLKKSVSPPKTLFLDGAVKSATGRLPSPALLERFPSLEVLSVAGVRLASLAGFPRLPALRRLSLPDNRISGAESLAALADAVGGSLRYLDLGNNRFAAVEELAPLGKVGVEVLDLYQCPVTTVKGYREKVFGMIPTLKYLDGVDAEGNERAETDEEEETDDDDDDEEEGEEEEEEGDGQEDGGDGDGDDVDDEEEEKEEEEGDEEEDEADEEEDEAEENEIDADSKDGSKVVNGSKGPMENSTLLSKRKRDKEDDVSG